MTLQRARIIKNAFPEATRAEVNVADVARSAARARYVASEILEARAEAARILEGARAEAASLVATATTTAAA